MEINKNNKEELMMKASFLERNSHEIQEKVNYLAQQLLELEEFRKDIDFFSKSKETKIFSTLGRGIYIKSALEDKKLFVNVGAGVVLKKTADETKHIIESQIKEFYDAKMQLTAQLEIYNKMLTRTVDEINEAEKSHKH